MARHGTRLGIGRIVVADDKTIDGIGVLLRRDLCGEAGYTGFHGTEVGVFQLSALDGVETLAVQPIHAVAPTRDVLVSIY